MLCNVKLTILLNFACPRRAARYMYIYMALKKSAKPVAKKPVKSAAKAVVKSVAKAVSNLLSKPKDKPKEKTKSVSKTEEKSVSKPTAKVAVAKADKSARNSKVATKSEAKLDVKNEKVLDKGDSLIKMAKEEMHKINAPAIEALEKAEKTGKFKPIKVERGNLADEKAKWQELFKRYGNEKAVNYKMSENFEAMKPMNHKVLGWGFILTNENNRLEILFENGIKVLICNYKP